MSFLGTALSFPLMFGEHSTTSCQESNSTGPERAEERQKGEGKGGGGVVKE